MKRDSQNPIIVVGGGAAGMMAACAAAGEGAKVLLLEKNEKLGKKIYITGKGRCNYTNCCETEDFFRHVPCNPRFLYSSIYGFDPHAVMDWFESRGLKSAVERGNRVFPASSRASDVTKTLETELKRLRVEIRLNCEVRDLLTDEGPERRVSGVRLGTGELLRAEAVILATGGKSYPSTGSTGDGYRFASSAGHKITELSPSLVPITVQDADIPEMQGLSLKNVRFQVRDGRKTLFDDFGEMMFTHFGVTGPLILSASADLQKQIGKKPLSAEIDLKPALSEEKLDLRIVRDFEQNSNKVFRNAVSGLYPARMQPVIIRRSGIPAGKAVHDITKAERMELIRVTKHFQMTLTGLRGFQEAVITHGGVSVKEVDPSTMESRILPGLYLAGELLDVDAYTGGFNLQIAWATGHAAGAAAAASAAERTG